MLETDRALKIIDYQSQTHRKEIKDVPNIKKIFAAPLGKLLILTDTQLVLYDIVSK